MPAQQQQKQKGGGSAGIRRTTGSAAGKTQPKEKRVNFCDGKTCATLTCKPGDNCPTTKDWGFLGAGFVISLKEDAARLRVFRKGLTAMSLPPELVRDHIVERHPEGGRTGCFVSHQQASDLMLRAGAKWGIVFEDDARPFEKAIDQAIVQEIGKLTEELKSEKAPVLITLGYVAPPIPMINGTGNKKKGYKHIIPIRTTFMAHAYILNDVAMRLIKEMDPRSMDFDRAFNGAQSMPSNFQQYAVSPQMFYQCDCGTSVTGIHGFIQSTIGQRGLQLASEFPVMRPKSYTALIVAWVALLALVIWLGVVPMFRPPSSVGKYAVGGASCVTAAVLVLGMVLVIAFLVLFFR